MTMVAEVEVTSAVEEAMTMVAEVEVTLVVEEEVTDVVTLVVEEGVVTLVGEEDKSLEGGVGAESSTWEMLKTLKSYLIDLALMVV